ncbi:MAG: hypothetical protein Q8O75_01165 [bacterium]|nr:hypothetical protein [bacterium]
MRITNNKFMLRELKANNPAWFSIGNKRFFHDRQYFFMYSGKTGNPYLVRSTYAWTDMFGDTARLHYRVNEIVENKEKTGYEVGNLLDDQFETLSEVKKWLGSI